VEDGLWILQYADDTILFIAHDLEQVENIKLMLCVFEQLSYRCFTATPTE
jgi:ABC-type dipeptide/oligopeptide/nickel transport system ATPase subunit